jgi:class I fructose-bisphosphate aldolase
MNISLRKITTRGKALYLAYDQGIEHGPKDFKGKNISPRYILDIAKKGKFNGVILQKGVAEKYYKKGKDIPLIIKLNGKTSLVKGDPLSLQNCSVQEAVKLGAKAVGYTIYIGSKHEAQMLKEFGEIEELAHMTYKIPVIVWVYPRGEGVKVNTDTIAYGARVGLEVGADIVKVKYAKKFRKVVDFAGECKVVCAGGSKRRDRDVLHECKGVMDAGAIGMAIGRNIWQSKHPLKLARALEGVIFKNKGVNESMKFLK